MVTNPHKGSRRFAPLASFSSSRGDRRQLLAEVLRGISVVTRSERVLSATGLTHEQAVLEVDSLLWDGVRLP